MKNHNEIINRFIESPEKNLPKLKQLYSDALQIDIETERADLLLKIGETFKKSGKYKNALEPTEKALTIFERKSETEKIVRCYYLLGECRLRMNLFDKSVKYFTLAFNASAEIENKKIHFNTAQNIGRIFNELGNYDKALKYLFIALEGYKKINDKSNTAGVYSNIGISYNDIGYYDKSIEYHLKAVEICIETKSERTLASIYLNSGVTYQNSKNYDSALEYFFKSLKISEDLNITKQIPYCLNNIGEIYELKKNFDSAMQYYNSAEEKVSENDKYPTANILFNLCKIYFHKKDFENVFKYLDKSIKTAEELNVKKMKLEIYKGAKNIYFELGNYKKAFEYQQKYFSLQLTVLNTETAKQITEIQTKQLYFTDDKSQYESSRQVSEIISNSDEMKEIFSLINMVGKHNVNVLITGPTGSGKELAAKAIHEIYNENSPFVAINCSAIPEHLLESELFGYAKGAFTGAVRDKKGKIESAENGTLFLDEIGDMPMSLQSKILRVIQERVVTPVGSTKIIPVSMRVISATNKNLQKSVKNGEFRHDLFFRLNVINIKIPALKNRRIDIPLLINHFIRKFNEKFSKNIRGISADALNYLIMLPWNGNVRELENVIEKAILLCGQELLYLELFTDSPDEKSDDIFENLPLKWSDYKSHKNKIIEHLDVAYVNKLLSATGENVREAGKKGGLDRAQIYRLLRKDKKKLETKLSLRKQT